MSLVGFKITNHPQQVGKRGASDTVDERITPASVFDPLNDEFRFDLDVAANCTNTKTRIFYDLADNGLTKPWFGRVWCNPPYSDIRPWVEKAWAAHREGCPLVVMLLPANRCEQRWWQDLIEPFRDGRGPLETRFYRGRFNFGLPDNPEGKFHSSPPFGCLVVIWRHRQRRRQSVDVLRKVLREVEHTNLLTGTLVDEIREVIDLAGEAGSAPAIAMAPKAETEGLRGLSPAQRGAKQSPKVSR